MGRNKRGGKPGAGRGGARQSQNQDQDRQDRNGPSDPWKTYTVEDMGNVGFEEYYKKQNIVPEGEWDTFHEILKTELPTTFRVTGSRANADTINDIIKERYVPTMHNVEWEGKKYDAPTQIDWYPDSLAWQLSAPKRVVRKTEPFKNFQRFLVGETEVGNLSRQEAVSMIPPLLMDIEPHHVCLDMCAAPGSKTAQIIEALNPHHTASSGLLIANDSDYRRTHMLVHQTGRMPSRGLIVTNLDATMIPNISLGDGKTLQFDRILADVPCSGDGTLRKNLEIWKKWNSIDGNSLHPLQLRILSRAMALLKPGGRLVYSTCSFNPAENEAVIAAALNTHAGEYEILDVSDQLPNLKRRPGMSSWLVATQPEQTQRQLKWHSSYDAYRAWVDEGNERYQDKAKGLASTVWAPENAGELGLERCLRLLPHDQNTGGFFVCVLHKLPKQSSNSAQTPLPVPEPEPEPEPTPTVEATVAATDESGTSTLKRELSPSAAPGPEAKRPVKPQPKKKEKRDMSFKEDPFSFVDPSHAEVQSCVDWFKFGSGFPKENLLVRNEYGDPLRSIYLTNDIVKRIIQNNDYTRLRIISAGVKALTRQDSQARTDIGCKWRIPSEGVLELIPHIGAGVVKEVGIRELKVLLEEQYPPTDTFHEDVKYWMRDAPLGNMIVRVAAGESDGGHLPLPIHLPVWKAKTSVSLLIDKREKSMLSLRVFEEDICKMYTGGGAPMGKKAEDGDGEEEQAHEEVAGAGVGGAVEVVGEEEVDLNS